MNEPVKIDDLAKSMIRLMGLEVRDEKHPDGDIAIEYIGLRHGEKLHEELLLGENITRTEHPRIHKSHEPCMPAGELAKVMHALHAAMDADDLLIDIEIPRLPTGMKSAYRRLHRYQRPTLGVAVGAQVIDGRMSENRLAVGCIGPKPERLTELENKLNGVQPADIGRLVSEEKTYLRDLLRPVDDLLGSADYKLYMACTMLTDALESVTRSNAPD